MVVPSDPSSKYKIVILGMKSTGGSNLRAFVDVQIGTSLTIYGFRVIQQPGQSAWVSAPQRTYQGDDGKTRYAPIMELKGGLKRAVELAILQAWREGADATEQPA
jgi:DNA-binding cell septation regulator SpoVG